MKSRNLILHLILLGLLKSVPFGLWAAEWRSFYRLDTSTNSRISSLTVDGILSWSNASASGDYIVERAADLTNGAWAPLTRGDFMNSLWSVKVHEPSPPPGMCFIPGGRFMMGDILGDLTTATPVHTVYLTPFFMARYEVSNEDVRQLLQWAYDQNLISVTPEGIPSPDGSTNLLFALNRLDSEISFDQKVFVVKAGRGNYPCVWVSWFGAVASCNYRSVMEAKEPCYNLTNWTCDFTRNGYRLPTESEWEFAARGGYEGLRFPWSDTNVITHTRANYRSTTNYSYDVSPTLGFHPTYAGVQPRSSPVGVFAPNSYGLYDLSGNVWEWCWDWAARYPAAPQHDPLGPESGLFRIFRGGSWLTVAVSTTCASRYTAMTPSKVFDDIGFRVILPYRN